MGFIDQPVINFGDGITAFCYLTDGFFLKFRCKSWCAHMLFLCSNYRAGSSTETGSVQAGKKGGRNSRGRSNTSFPFAFSGNDSPA
ncbi:hypothetical protein C2U55_00135 [Enterobacteriaceae bacterium ENNIH3]|nr:hypothetical protein C2U55_00135 [Enterobacteriaceae bacterium ENNIH3]AUV07101.1 hypothetical protein C2U52_12820 [Enterobacteriaceae bacterium ENNIH2]PWF53746.1 hypothetical protein BHT19_0023760 [[Kluyvera] intestini]